MQQRTYAWIFVKSFIFLVVFGILHFMYTVFPIHPFAVIGGVNETVFQHMKLAYFAYIVTILIEFGFFKKRIGDREEFWGARLLTVLLIPWMEILIWFILPVFIALEPLAFELIYSIIVLYIMGILGGILDFSFSSPTTIVGKRVLLALNIVAIFIFVAYSFTEPYIGVFFLHGH